MIDVQNFKVFDKLKNGSGIIIRAIRPDDKIRIVEAFKNMDAESIYTRFFRFKSSLTDNELKTVTEVDFEKTVALVVTIPTVAGEETIIGAGRYILFDPPNPLRSAEVAFMVEEDYHGQGIASRIFGHLVHIAREKGVLRFEAEVLPGNKAMVAVFARSGLRMKQLLEDGVVHVTLSLYPDTA